MTWWREVVYRLCKLIPHRRTDEAPTDEIRSHLETDGEEIIANGMASPEARRMVHLKRGNSVLAREGSRTKWGFVWLGRLGQDLRYGVRVLRGSRGFATAAIVSLALGIGANTLIYSLLDTIFFRPLRYPDADRLVAVQEVETDKPNETWGVARPNFYDWREQSQSFEHFAIVHWSWSFILIGDQQTEQLAGRRVSEGYLQMLAARACHGRLLEPEDFAEGTEASSVVVLSNGAWERVFGSDPGIVGNWVNLEGRPRLVAGVMCPDFRPLWGGDIDLWTQIARGDNNRKGRYFSTVARLRKGVDIEVAQAEMDVIAKRLEEEYAEQQGFGARVIPLQEYLYGRAGKRYLLFFGAVGFVLLIACANVANLMLVRASSRNKEMAVRASLGAGRRRLVRQLLTESLLLATAGAMAGLLLAYGGMKFLVGMSPESAIPRADEVAMNWRIFGFTVGIAILTGLLSGLFPAVGASKPNLNESLKETGKRPTGRFRGRYLQSVLAAGEVALSLVLLIGAGLMIHNVWKVLNVHFGFNPERLLSLTVDLPRNRYVDGSGEAPRMTPDAVLALERIHDRLEAVPGLIAVEMSTNALLWGCPSRMLTPGSAPPPDVTDDQPPWVCYVPASTDYLRMLGVPLLKGRLLEESDHAGSEPVAIINESAARKYFPDEDSVGRLVTMGQWDNKDTERRKIVGVVADFRHVINREPLPSVYIPYRQLPLEFRWPHSSERTRVSFIIRTAIEPAALKTTLQRAVAEVAADVPVLDINTIDDVRSQSTLWSRYYTWLLAVFAGIALALAVIGVFGVVSYSVSQRTHEIGIRMAMGAQRRDVLGRVLRQGVWIALAGLTIGLGGAFGLTRLLESQLYEVEPTDPWTFAAVAVMMATATLVACLLPALRASRIQPMEALRHE